jgi:hypothetical protein
MSSTTADSENCCAASRACRFGKRLIVGYTPDAVPPINDDDACRCEDSLVKQLFRYAMDERGIIEGCDYQFVIIAPEQMVVDGALPGPAVYSGYVDVALAFAPSQAARNNFLFALPFFDSAVADEYAVAPFINKKSKCAKKFAYAFNVGLAHIISNGRYANTLLECQATQPIESPWCETPTADSHASLFALNAFDSNCHLTAHESTGGAFDHTILIAAGDLTTPQVPWHDMSTDSVDSGLARLLFIAAMATHGMVEDRDYQFVSPVTTDVMAANSGEFAGAAVTSGWVDAALSFVPSKRRTNVYRFGVPMYGDDDTAYGHALLINKKSPCCEKLQRLWNAGVANLICSGEYTEIVEAYGDTSFTAWTALPTSTTFPSLFPLITSEPCAGDHHHSMSNHAHGDHCDDAPTPAPTPAPTAIPTPACPTACPDDCESTPAPTPHC